MTILMSVAVKNIEKATWAIGAGGPWNNPESGILLTERQRG